MYLTFTIFFTLIFQHVFYIVTLIVFNRKLLNCWQHNWENYVILYHHYVTFEIKAIWRKWKLHSFRSNQQIYIPFICFCFHFEFGLPVFYVNLLFTKQLFMPSKTFSFFSVALLFCSLYSHILSIFSPFYRIPQSRLFFSSFRFLLLCFCSLKVYFVFI